MTPEPTNITLLPQPVPTLSTDLTSYSTAVANSIHSAALEAADWNTRDQWMFDQERKDYNANMAAGSKNPNLNPPVAPYKWIIEPPQPGGFAAAVRSTTEQLTSSIPLSTFNAAVPIVYPPGHADIGHQIGDSAFYTAMPDDTIPGNEEVMWSDGRIYVKRTNPWSVTGQYILKGA